MLSFAVPSQKYDFERKSNIYVIKIDANQILSYSVIKQHLP